MNHSHRLLVCIMLGLICVSPATASDKPSGGGQVQLPLDVYQTLLQQASNPDPVKRPAPAGYALGRATVTVSVSGVEPRASGAVQVQLDIQVLEDQWVLIPVLPPGTSVESVTVGGKQIQLMATPQGLAWSTRQSGPHLMRLAYKVDASRSQAGYTLAIPLPRAAAINLTANLPGTGLDAAVIPSAGLKSDPMGENTLLRATIPTTDGAQISWRTPGKRGHTISRATYSGKLVGDAVVWTGRLGVELFSGETVTLPLLPLTVTLSDLSVDGKEATILVEDARFATLVQGRGTHDVEVVFQVAVQRRDGPPRIDFQIPEIPVSRFDLALPGKKELTVVPASNVTTRTEKGSTIAVVHVPMTGRVSFTWSEAVPEEVRAEVRSNVAIYHTVHAEEGVLYVRAMVALEVNRGETNVIDLWVPGQVQINRISAVSGAVADWRVHDPGKDGRRVVSVFLDRQLRGKLLFDVYYDRSLRPDEGGESGSLLVPLIEPVQAQRQKGMVALLSNAELTLKPIEVDDATKVGENQLPAFVRDAAEMTVAHTFKYTEKPPLLVVEPTIPERVQGKFDAQVDTLISLGT